MSTNRGFRQMLIPTIVMAVLAVVFVFLVYQKGGTPQLIEGLKGGGNMLLQMAPLLVLAMVIAGIIPLLIPPETISQWVGEESGFRGILIGTLVGGFMPGGPYVSLPVAAGLIRVGANVGTMVALLTGWSLLAFTRAPMEIGLMGWKFWLIRLACNFFFPPIAGLMANRLFSNVSLT